MGFELNIQKHETTILKQKRKVTSFPNRDFQILDKKLGDKHKHRFYNDFSLLLESGIDVGRCLQALIEEEDKHNRLFKSIYDNVVGGMQLHEALEASEQFSIYEIQTLRIGEESAMLPRVVKELALFYERKIEQRQKLISALSYPILILLTALGAIFFMLNFIVPMFSDVFQRFGSDLPLVTQIVVSASDSIHLVIIPLFCLTLGFIILTITQKSKLWYRKLMGTISLKVPIVGRVILKSYLAKMSFSLNLLLKAKTPITQSLGLVSEMISFYPLSDALQIIKHDIIKGESLSSAMQNHSIFSKQLILLVKIAEETNQLEIVFEQISNQLTKELEHQSGIISKVLEPIIILFVGILVAVILVAMYLPMFSMGTVIN